MKYLSKYRKYITNHINENKLYESRGIPNDLKWITDEIYDKISIDYNNEYLFDFDGIIFKVKDLSIICKNENHSNIIGNSRITSFENNILLEPKIILKFNFDSVNKLNIKKTILHELLHLYELYKRIINDSDKSLQWDSLNLLQTINKKYENDSFLDDFIHIVYLTSDHEINAMVAEVYTVLIDIGTNNKDRLLEELYKTTSWQKLSLIENFSISKYNIDYNNCIKFFTEYDSYMSNISKQKFNIFNIPVNKNDVDDLFKLYKNLFHKKSIKIRNKLIKIVDEVINDF